MHEVELIWVFRIDFGVDDQQVCVFGIQASKQIGRLNGG
jgi:hypothetical protein